MVTVYQFQRYDITTDTWRTSRRWGTREAIEDLGGSLRILVDTATQVSELDIRSDVPGLTQVGFDPHLPKAPPRRQAYRTGLH